MSQIQQTIFHLICFYLCLVSTLPITSKPLDNTGDHLTWEAWLTVGSQSSDEFSQKTRKITPKSIFITPNFINGSTNQCPPGYKSDSAGHCIETIHINPASLVVSRIQDILANGHDGNTEDEDTYDYEAYDTDTDTGPYQINLPISFNNDPLPSAFKGSNFQEYPIVETTPGSRKKPFLEYQETTFPTILEVLPISTEIPTTTIDDFISTTDLVETTTDLTTNTEEQETTTLSLIKSSSTTETDIILNLANSTDINDSNSNGTNNLLFIQSNNNENNEKNDSQSEIELKELKKELQKESLILDENYTGNDTDLIETTTIMNEEDETTVNELSETTLFVVDEDIQVETTIEPAESLIFVPPSTTTSTTTTTTKTTTTKKPTTESLLIVTPEKVEPTTERSVFKSELGELEKSLLSLDHDSETNKNNRNILQKHEAKESALENIDTSNRFVYHHLGSDQKMESSSQNVIEQLKIINKIVEENKKFEPGSSHVRFPSGPEPKSDTKTEGLIRFPGPTTYRLISNNQNQLVPDDTIPKKPPEQKPPFWWLPTNWEVDQTAQKPMLLRFWSRLPATGNNHRNNNFQTPQWRSVSHNRENSRSPTESLYKEVSANEAYKVLGSRNFNHNR